MSNITNKEVIHYQPIPPPMYPPSIGNGRCLTVIFSFIFLLRDESEILRYKKNTNAMSQLQERECHTSLLYKFPLQHTFLSIPSVITQILLVAMEMSLMMASNRIISLFFSLPPNKKIATQVHRPLGIPQICFGQFVKSQKMYANLFTFFFYIGTFRSFSQILI